MDLSRRFRAAYTIAISGGVAMTVLSTVLIVRDVSALRAHLVDPSDHVVTSMITSAWLRAGSVVALLLLLWRFVLRPMADHLGAERNRLHQAEAAQRAIRQRQDLSNQVLEACSMAEDEPAVHRVVARALARIAPDLPSELLLADSSRAHVQQVAANPVTGGPGCGVGSPNGCPAVRRGRTTVFESSENLNACPHLVDRPSGPCSAICIPVSSMGRNLGVLHVAGPDGEPPAVERTDGLSVVATQAGIRIDNLRSVARMQLQASTDGLTGLSNRRATSELVARLLRGGAEVVAVAMVDLDHFKKLNDTWGHQAGDEALRVASRAVMGAIRCGDLAVRYGGEEVAILLSRAGVTEATTIAERAAAAMKALPIAGLPTERRLTCSQGVAVARYGEVLDDVIRRADLALLRAKRGGRDRIEIDASPV